MQHPEHETGGAISAPGTEGAGPWPLAHAATVLVVDDDDAIRSVMAEALVVLGYRTVEAIDGLEALEILERGLVPSAVVLDLMMPRMDGWTFLRRLRADPRFAELPVVVATAAIDPPEGADAVLRKPFDLELLERTVARLCAH